MSRQRTLVKVFLVKKYLKAECRWWKWQQITNYESIVRNSYYITKYAERSLLSKSFDNFKHTHKKKNLFSNIILSHSSLNDFRQT